MNWVDMHMRRIWLLFHVDASGYWIKGYVMLHPTIGNNWKKLVYLFRVCDLYFQICIDSNLDIETSYKMFIQRWHVP